MRFQRSPVLLSGATYPTCQLKLHSFSSFTLSAWPSKNTPLIAPGNGSFSGHEVGNDADRLPCRGITHTPMPDACLPRKSPGGLSVECPRACATTPSPSTGVRSGCRLSLIHISEP